MNPVEHVVPQSIPEGELVILPLPTVFTVNIDKGENVAVTCLFEDKVSMQVLLPEQSPPHPVNVVPAAGVAMRVTTVPSLKFESHFAID